MDKGKIGFDGDRAGKGFAGGKKIARDRGQITASGWSVATSAGLG
jgi:hypothetical protein